MREDFLKNLPQDSIGAELGVMSGKWSKCILEIVRPKELHLIDCWWTKYGEYFPWMEPGKEASSTVVAYNQALRTVQECDKKKVSVFHVQDDLECLKKFKDGYFDWIYIDSSHEYGHTRQELLLSRNKVKEDGIICGHDWRPNKLHVHHGVYRAVNEFCASYNYKIVKLDPHWQWAIKKTNNVLISPRNFPDGKSPQ